MSVKNLTPIILILLISEIVQGQTTLMLQPGPTEGKDAALYENYPNTNLGSDEAFISYYWTFSGDEYAGFSLIEFDLSTLPAGIQINSARLSLYYNPTSASAGQAGNNACHLKKITSSWDENTVTWNNMPTSSTSNQVLLPTSSSADQDYLDIDITNIVVDWCNDPSTNFGLKLELIDLSLYNSMKFCSSDYPDELLRPKLEINYTRSDLNVNPIKPNEFNVNVYPNPSKGVYFITFKNIEQQEEIYIEVFDAFGKSVHKELLLMSNSADMCSLDISDLNKGIYTFKISSGKAFYHQKIVLE